MIRRALFAGWIAVAGCCAQDVVTPPGPGEDAAAASSDDARVQSDRDATSPDATTADGGTVFLDAMSAMSPDAASSNLACHVDRFDSCDDPQEMAGANDEPSDAFNVNSSSAGCQSRDTFTPGGFVRASIICPLEMADWYSTNFVPCDSITYIAEYRLHPITACEPGALRLEVQNRPCTDPDVRCTTSGGDQIVTFTVPPGNSVGSFKAGVIRVDADVKLDYELTYSVRR